jgi:hypothetical protein
MLSLIYFGKVFWDVIKLGSQCAPSWERGSALLFFDFDWKAQRWNLVAEYSRQCLVALLL